MARRRTAAAALAAALLAACAPAPPPNALVIVVDSLRRDRLGCYGHGRPTSPHVDALARSGVRYTDAVSPAPWTTPAVAALLTSQMPTRLGIFMGNRPLPPDLVLLSEALKPHGYATGAVVSHTYIGSEWRFDQGYDVFEERSVGAHESSSADVTDAALGFLDAHGAGPFFLLVHYFDPHFPYLEHAGFEMGGRGDYAGPIRPELPWTFARALASKLEPADRDELLRLYDSEIGYTDAEIGRLLAGLDERGLAERTLVVFTADHGEEFLERGHLGHTLTLYDELVAVPLIVRYPGGKPGVDDRPASLLDVFPTVLDVAGVEPPGPMAGTSLLAERAPERPLLSETSRGARLRGVVSGDFKLIYDGEAKAFELYDRAADPAERRNLARSRAHADVRRRLTESLKRWPSRRAPAGAPVEISESERERLRALGYADE